MQLLSHLSTIGTTIKSPVCSKYMKFQKTGEKNWSSKKNSHEIPKNGGKNWNL